MIAAISAQTVEKIQAIEPSAEAVEAGMWAIFPYLIGFDMTQADKAAMLKDLYRSMRAAELAGASGLSDAEQWERI